jgi:hypothetical protein
MELKKFLPLIGILIFAAVIYYIGPQNISASFLSANLLFIALAFAIIPLIVFFQVWKWKILIDAQKIRIGWLELTKIYLIGFFYGAITPGKLGSFIRISYLSKASNLATGKAASSVITDRITDFFSVFFIAVFGAALAASFFSDILLVTTIAFLAMIALIWFFSSKGRASALLKKFFNIFVPEKLKDKTSEIFHDFYDSMPGKGTILKSQFLSIISWLLIFLHSYVVALAFSINVPVQYIIGFVALASVVSLLPITFNGLGTNEASMIALFSLLGVSASSVFAFSIASSILLTYFMAFVGFLVSLSYRNKN